MAKKRSLDELKALFQPHAAPFDVELSAQSVDTRLLDAPQLVFYVFHDAFGFPVYGPEEKMRIGVQGIFGGVPFAFEWRKFGLRLLLPPDKHAQIKFVRSLQVAVRDAIHHVSVELQRNARQQVYDGNVTLANKFREFHDAYRFFRTKAAEAYAQPPGPPIEHRDANGFLFGMESSNVQPMIDGSYYATAMLHEYFSLMEHVFLLGLAFTPFDPSNGGLRAAASERSWGAKLRTLIDIKSDVKAERLHGALVRLKDDMRNPLSHGGVKVGDQSFYFHLQGHGPLPMSFHRDAPDRWELGRLTRKAFEEVCALFDEFDSYLETGATSYAMKYIKAGLDVAFDKQSRSEYQQAMSDPKAFDLLIEQIEYMTDVHSNMDY